MSSEQHTLAILNALAEVLTCPHCDTRLRFGDWECPHCGKDLDDTLRRWAAHLLDRLNALPH
ncbi:MAG: hypothetical protein HYU30_02300 [Chloroflexi bacterium]|nr:hypothetical protein [Chloroflexota bacterium]MBI4198147.1 hypothetical protein [Chloroflexota bacterium]